MDKFLALKELETHKVSFEMTYVDMAGGDLIAGLLLSQIVFWFLPSKKGNNKTRATYKGKRAIAKNREDWYEEIRITPRQYDRAIQILKELDIVNVENSMFAGKRTPFIMLNGDVFLQLYDEKINGICVVLHKRQDRCSLKGNTGNNETSRPLTDITTEISPEITKKNIRECPGDTHERPLHYSKHAFTSDDKKEIVKYYMCTYENYMGKPHPKLNPSQWQRVDEGLDGCIDRDNDNEFTDMAVYEWKAIIDQHFNTEYENCDYNILHFISEGVKLRRMYEVAY